MKKILSLLVVATLMLCLLSVSAFAQATIIYEGQSADGITSNNAGSVVNDTPATIIDSNGTILSDGTGSEIVNNGNVVVTKSPTSETVEKGGKASFVAHAANSTGITWRLVSSDTMETINAAAIPQYFTGAEVYGIGTDRLTIRNITENMNGWSVEAKFDGPNGPVYTYGARISVVGSSANGTTTDQNPTGRVVIGAANGDVPTITSQPEGAELTSGKSTTLSVTAGTGGGGTLRYQWYVSTSDDTSAGQAIAGATSASYTPGELQGTRYYYVGVWTEKDGVKSDTVYSNTAAVVYSGPAATPSPSPAPSAAPSNTNSGTTNNAGGNTTGNTSNTNTGSNGNGLSIVPDPNDPDAQTEPDGQTVVTTPEPTRSSETEQRSSLPVVLGAIAAVALAAGVGLLVLRRNAGQ